MMGFKSIVKEKDFILKIEILYSSRGGWQDLQQHQQQHLLPNTQVVVKGIIIRIISIILDSP